MNMNTHMFTCMGVWVNATFLPGTQGELGAHVGRETSGNAGGRWKREGGREKITNSHDEYYHALYHQSSPYHILSC